MYLKTIKPLFDFVISLVLLSILSLIILLIIILLLIANSGKVFFIQERPGKDEKIFKLIKFKTMNDKTDSDGNLLPDEKRLTIVGNIIRKLSLDELLQFINVLKGDMSLIGPRPLLIEYLPLYNEFQMCRHEVRPGITGWAQVNGRNAISWEQKFEYDVWYVNHVSFGLDMKILFLTILKVLRGTGINSSDSVTMEKFKG